MADKVSGRRKSVIPRWRNAPPAV